MELHAGDEDMDVGAGSAVGSAVLDRSPRVPIGGQPRKGQPLEVVQHAGDVRIRRPVVGVEGDHSRRVAVHRAQRVGSRRDLARIAHQDPHVVPQPSGMVPRPEQVVDGLARGSGPVREELDVHRSAPIPRPRKSPGQNAVQVAGDRL